MILAVVAALTAMTLGETRVDVQERRILLSETIRFDHTSATIKKASFKILDALARTLKEKTEIELLRIEGHNDSLGVAAKAMALSEGRAAAVKRYLVSKGVAENRLLAKGYGQEWPISSNWAAAGRGLNRRVDFVLVKVQGREVGRRELPKLYARIHAAAGISTAVGAGEEKPRNLVQGAAVFPGDRVTVPDDGEITLVFPTLHFVVLVGPADAEIAKADAWSADNPITVRLAKGRARIVVTQDSSKDVAVRMQGTQADCMVVRDDKTTNEFALVESGQETIVETALGTATCLGLSVPPPGLRFTASGKPPLERPPAPAGLAPAGVTPTVGPVDLSWAKPGPAVRAARLEIATNPVFLATTEVRTGLVDKARVTLPPGTYFWRVIAVGADGIWSFPTKVHSFVVKTEAAP